MRNQIKLLIYSLLKRVAKHTIMTNENNVLAPVSVYNIRVTDIQGREATMDVFRGKKILIVNTASECGYTPQYESLQQLHQNYGDKIAVLGFPCNDFGAQEPADELTIKAFCQSKYHITFPLFSKIHVIGEKQHPLYTWLSDPGMNGWNSQTPTWNFCKYLLDEEGRLLHFFGASVDPLDKMITG